MTDTQRSKATERNRRYGKTNKGRACYLRKAYQRIDACDLTTDEIASIIAQPCAYCQTQSENRGLDRKDNSLPHTRGNVLPACRDCNVLRNDRFTVEEMMILGAAMKTVRESRLHGPHWEIDPRRYPH